MINNILSIGFGVVVIIELIIIINAFIKEYFLNKEDKTISEI